MVLDKGHVLATGSTDEIRGSDNARVQDLLNRRFEEEALDAEAYLARLTAAPGTVIAQGSS